MKTILKGATLIDVIKGKCNSNSQILIEGNVIRKINYDSSLSYEEKVDIIDLNGKYVLPGIVNMHQHYTYKRTYGSLWRQLEMIVPGLTVRALRNAIAELRMGITTVRSAGEIHDIDYALKYMFQSKFIVGPRMIITGKPLAITGSHVPPVMAQWIDGVDEFVKWSRQRANKYDWVKIFANSGLTTPHTNGEYSRPEVSLEELRAACEATHNAGKKVMVHCTGSIALQNAITAGVDSIEHGTYLTEEQAEEIAKARIAYVPTLTALTETLNPIYDRGKQWIEDHKKTLPFKYQSLKRAHNAGALICMGLDSLGVIGDEAMQMKNECGIDPLEILRIFTFNGAEALGLAKEIGSIEEGKIADILVLNSNPIENLMNLEDVYMVVKDGEAKLVQDINLSFEFETRDHNTNIPELFLK